MKKILLAFAAASALFCGHLWAKAPKANKTLPFSKGVNMPVWMEYGRFNSLLYGKKDFENLKSIGVEAVRIPVWFDIWADKANDYLIDQECFDILDRAIDWCENLGLYVIIDFHNDCSGASQTPPRIENVLLKIWPQIAARYKSRSDKVIYEVMNEPHFESGNTKADIAKWGKVQGKVLEAIRAVDTKHYVVVGGGYWDSLDSMLSLPFYKDDKLIYNFHDYTPFLFTHQGASWTFSKRIKQVPFPYSKEKMPPLPPNATDAEKWEMDNYEQDSSEKTLSSPLDKAVEFANKRNAALMCNEFGVLMTYADSAERANWYRTKCKWMDERNIARLSWDYTQEFGLFKSANESRFPDDLNKQLLDAMGYKYPEGAKSETWFSHAKESGDWTIYKDGSADHIQVQSWSVLGSLAESDTSSSERFISLKELKPYDELLFQFKEACDFTSLKDSGAKLEFYVKSLDKWFDITVYFRDMESKIFPWRASFIVGSDIAKSDGRWHKVSIPLSSLNDVGGWTEKTQWKNSEGKFDWKLIDALVFQNNNHSSKEGYALRDIKIVQ
jgi:endoglucanase